MIFCMLKLILRKIQMLKTIGEKLQPANIYSSINGCLSCQWLPDLLFSFIFPNAIISFLSLIVQFSLIFHYFYGFFLIQQRQTLPVLLLHPHVVHGPNTHVHHDAHRVLMDVLHHHIELPWQLFHVHTLSFVRTFFFYFLQFTSRHLLSKLNVHQRKQKLLE